MEQKHCTKLTEAEKRTKDELSHAREHSAKLRGEIRKLETALEAEKENHKKTLQELEKLKRLHGKGNETKEVEITPDGLQKKQSTTESLTQKEQDQTRRNENFKEDDERLLKKCDYLDQKNNEEKQSDNFEPAKEEQEKIRQLQWENKQLKEKVTENTLEFEKDSLKNFQAETKDKDVLLKNMRVENKRLLEESRAERSMCDHLREEVRRLREMPGRVHPYEKDFDRNGVVYALVKNFGSPNSTQASITATRSSDGEGKTIDILENRVDREVVSGTKAEEKSWWCVDLTENYTLYLTHYTLRHGHKTSLSCLLNWRLEGSLDGQSWETLRRHDNDRGLRGQGRYCTCTWSIRGNVNAFRYFRILQTGKNSSGIFGIFLSGIELYGVLIEIGSQC